MKVERALRRAQDARGMGAATLDEVASYILNTYILNKAADNQVVVGPLVYRTSDGSEFSCLVIGTGDAEGQYHCDLAVLPGR